MTVKEMISKIWNKNMYSVLIRTEDSIILEAEASSMFWNDSNTFTEAEVDSFNLEEPDYIVINIKGFKSIDVQENWTIPEPARSWMFDDFEDIPEASEVIGSDE